MWITKNINEKYVHELDKWFINENAKLFCFLTIVLLTNNRFLDWKLWILFFPNYMYISFLTYGPKSLWKHILKGCSMFIWSKQLRIQNIDKQAYCKQWNGFNKHDQKCPPKQFLIAFITLDFKKGYKIDLNKENNDLSNLKSMLKVATEVGCNNPQELDTVILPSLTIIWLFSGKLLKVKS